MRLMEFFEEVYKNECELQARIAADCGAPHGSDLQRVQEAKDLFLSTAATLGLTVDPAVIDSVFEPKPKRPFSFELMLVVARITKTTGRHAALDFLSEVAGGSCPEPIHAALEFFSEVAGGRLVVPVPDQEDAANPLEYGCAMLVEQTPETVRKTIDSRKVIIDAYLDARRGTGMNMLEFHNTWKAKHPDAPPYSTFARWMSRYREGGVKALADMRQVRTPRGPQIDARLRALFIDLYLSQHRRPINYCVRLVNEYAADLGIDCPSPQTFGRLVRTIPHHIKILKRFGRKARGDAKK